jgi:hypothetical protein
VQVYALLAVNARQLSPSVVAVKISEQGDFGVSELHLQKTSRNKTNAGAYRSTWFRNVHSTLQANMQTIAHNPLYSNNCSEATGCPNRHWTCPFVLSALFGGSARARIVHENIQLITPGKHRAPSPRGVFFLGVVYTYPYCTATALWGVF